MQRRILRKRKKLKRQEKSLAKAETRDLRHKMKNMCTDFKMMSTTQAIVRQKLRRDEKRLKTDLKGICNDLERLLETKEEEEADESDKVEVAVVEDLACKVDHLMIGQEELARPGFVYTRWQQRKFLERLNLLRRRGEPKQEAALSPDLCCQSPNLCAMHSQNLFHDL